MGTKEIDALCDWLAKVPVTVAVSVAERVPVVAVKITLATPAGTGTDAGTERAALLLDTVSVEAAVVALLNDAVQLLDPLLDNVDGAQLSDVSCVVPALILMVALCEPPPNAAEIVAVPSALIVPTVTVKLADV